MGAVKEEEEEAGSRGSSTRTKPSVAPVTTVPMQPACHASKLYMAENEAIEFSVVSSKQSQILTHHNSIRTRTRAKRQGETERERELEVGSK